MTDSQNDHIYRFNFVTDPDDPNISIEYNMLMELLDNNKTIILTEENIDRGLVKYNITVLYNYNQPKNYINNITELVGKISYIPIITSMNVKKFKNNLGSVITAAEIIIKHLTQKIIKTNIINVESTRYDNDIIIFNPITDYNTAVYQNSSYLSNYYNTINMEKLGGYQVLSDDPMVMYVLDDLYKKNDYVPTDINVIYVKDIALIPVGKNINEEKYYSNIINDIDTIIRKKRSKGYFSYDICIHNLEDLELIHELAQLWDIKIIYDEDMIHIILQTDVDFGVRPEIWLRDNLSRVKLGYFPTITLYGKWQFHYNDDYNQIFGKIFYDIILHYGALLSYRKIGNKDEFIQPFTHTVDVNNDLSITISIPSYNHVKMFRKYLDEILNGYMGIEQNGSETWIVEPCDSLIDGIIKRWHVQTIDKRSMPMVLYHVNEDGSKGNVLVFRSPVGALYRKDHPFSFVNVDIKEVELDLISQLRKSYNKCNISMNMDLLGLLDLVEIENKYCLSKDTILNYPLNPITKLPFKNNVLSKAMLLEWGLRGLFNVGPLKGLYDNIPEKILIQPKVGTPIFFKTNINVEDMYVVEISFEDSTISPLFDITTSDISELKKLVKSLWKKGYFLNYWTSSIQKYVPDINSYSVIITDPILLNASNSKSDGTKAIKYLKNLSPR